MYTSTGDNGTTGLLGEGRLPKFHPRLETLGTIDEASAALGLARSLCKAKKIAPILLEIQRDLYSLMAEVAAPPENAARFRSLDSGRVQWLESQAEAVSAALPPLPAFILPGDSPGGAALSLARTIVRRAERRVAALLDQGEIENQVLLQYLNRLSDALFVMARYENRMRGIPDVCWDSRA